MKINNTTEKVELGKRVRIPVIVSEVCPKCGTTIVRDLAYGTYLCYPVTNEPMSIGFYCEKCDCCWNSKDTVTIEIRIIKET
ncbi:MAG: hypothetical protein GY861_05720 [bacterium]|nr:hypothetical protein [bacterium]